MAYDKKKPVGMDMLLALGKGDSSDDEESADSSEDDVGVPPDFEAAYHDYRDSPSPETMWEMIKSCIEGMK